MNIFFLLKTAEGVELVTPTLKHGDILAGVTRDSILGLARDWAAHPTTHSPEGIRSFGKLTVSERDYTMSDLLKASKEHRVRALCDSAFAPLRVCLLYTCISMSTCCLYVYVSSCLYL